MVAMSQLIRTLMSLLVKKPALVVVVAEPVGRQRPRRQSHGERGLRFLLSLVGRWVQQGPDALVFQAEPFNHLGPTRRRRWPSMQPTLEERVARLETTNRRAKRLAIGLFVCLLAESAVVARKLASPPGEVQARTVRLGQ